VVLKASYWPGLETTRRPGITSTSIPRFCGVQAFGLDHHIHHTYARAGLDLSHGHSRSTLYSSMANGSVEVFYYSGRNLYIDFTSLVYRE
jgi:hypothetical protein